MLAIVCPGQGSQTPGFLAPWLELDGTRDLLASLSDAAGVDLIRHGTESDEETIKDTAVAQPLIVAAGLVAAAALEADAAAPSAPAEADAGTAEAGPETATDDAEDTAEPFAGYGWVAADIPELAIAVLPDHQGEGIGTALLDVLLSLARMSGVEAVSLAVEDGNGAKNLYTGRGFATVGRNGDSDLMVRQLR